jgi:anti-sigma factor ChrR (cupin superfamily)
MSTLDPLQNFDPATRPAHLQSHLVDAQAMPWSASQFAGIEMKILYSDASSGMSTIVFKLAAGAVVPLHEHTAVEQTYVLEGSLEDDEGEVHAGGFVWRPGGNIHIATAPRGAIILSIFMKPNRFHSGVKFFTESAAALPA